MINDLSFLKSCGGTIRSSGIGTGEITGTTLIDSVPAPCRVTLFSLSQRIGFRRTGNDGQYSFKGLPPGNYLVLVEDDMQGQRQPVVEIVEVT